jgi:pimeloyl-ACP methyl ester carboxylesterase
VLEVQQQVHHRFCTVAGVRFHIAEAGPPEAPVVLLLHGFPQHWYMWRDVIPRLAATHRVLALDLRGAGRSDAPARGYATADRVRDVLGVLDALGVDRADVVGHDWGGWLGFRLALDHPDRVRRLVSISMAHPWPLQRHLAPRVWRWWVTALFEIPGVGDRILRTRPQLTGWLLSRDAARPEVWTPALREVYAGVVAEPDRAAAGRRLHARLVVHDIPRLLLGRDRHEQLAAPTLLLVGDRDALLPAAVLTVPASRADVLTLRTVPGGHFVVDENPDDVAAEIRAHLMG